jgi:DNA replication protein DnaC
LERLEAAKLPARFTGKEFDAFHVSNEGQKRALEIGRQYVENFEDHLTAGRCLVFCGKPGTGKTLLACIIGTSLIHSRRAVEYMTAPRLIRNLRSSWNGGGGFSENAQLHMLQELDMLILDEIGLPSRSASSPEARNYTAAAALVRVVLAALVMYARENTVLQTRLNAALVISEPMRAVPIDTT